MANNKNKNRVNENNNENIKKDTKDIEKDNKGIEKDTKDIEKDNKGIEKDTKDIEKDNKSIEKDTKDIGKDNKSIEKDTKDIGKENKSIKKDTKNIENDNKSIGEDKDDSIDSAKKAEASDTSYKDEYVTTVDPEEALFKDEDHKDSEKAKSENSKSKDEDKDKTKGSEAKDDDKSDSDSSKDEDINENDADDSEEDIEKARKKARFWKAFDIGQIIMIIVLLVVCLFGTYKLYQNMTAVRFTRALALAQSAQDNKNYADAIKYYEQAIGIDSKSIIAYEELANCYATLDDTENVMNVLYNGWLNTSDQSMLDNYISLKLNSVIATIQTTGGSFDAVEDVLDVLKIDGSNEDALQLLGTLYSYCMIDKNSSGDSVLFWSAEDDGSTFEEYKAAVSSMLDIYEIYPSDELEMLIARYIIPEGNVVWINTKNCSDYALLVKDARSLLGESSSLNSFIACLENADKVSGVFDNIWPLIESEDVEPFRDFMISDDVISLKESLINGEDQYLELEMENAFCQEGIVMTLEDNSWTYHFPDFSENPSTKGVITLQLTYDEVQAAEEAIAALEEQEELKSQEEEAIDSSEGYSDEETSDVDSSDIDNSKEDNSDEEKSDIENSANEGSNNSSNKGSSDKDSSNKNSSNKDSSNKNSSNKDSSNKDSSNEESLDDEDTEEESEEIVRSGIISMNYEPSVTGGTYFPHVTYYLTCEYEGDVVNYTYQKVVTSDDGSKTRTTVNNWGDEDLETIVDEEMEEEEETSSDNEISQPSSTSEAPAETNTTPNVIVDPETGAMFDPNTGLQIDPGTGFYIDPATGLYIDPNTWTYIDPATGAVVDPNAATQTPDTGTPEATPDAAAEQGAGA